MQPNNNSHFQILSSIFNSLELDFILPPFIPSGNNCHSTTGHSSSVPTAGAQMMLTPGFEQFWYFRLHVEPTGTRGLLIKLPPFPSAKLWMSGSMTNTPHFIHRGQALGLCAPVPATNWQARATPTHTPFAQEPKAGPVQSRACSKGTRPSWS